MLWNCRQKQGVRGHMEKVNSAPSMALTTGSRPQVCVFLPHAKQAVDSAADTGWAASGSILTLPGDNDRPSGWPPPEVQSPVQVSGRSALPATS
jgi:hypothetical protein